MILTVLRQDHMETEMLLILLECQVIGTTIATTYIN
jgi:hypothetical protein